MPSTPDLIVLHEHPEWQKPLFAALDHRGVPFSAFDYRTPFAFGAFYAVIAILAVGRIL